MKNNNSGKATLIYISEPKSPSNSSLKAIFFQTKPIPLDPLEVWCGFSNNIYFDPIKINCASFKTKGIEMKAPPLNNCSIKLQEILIKSRLNPERLINKMNKDEEMNERCKQIRNQDEISRQKKLFESYKRNIPAKLDWNKLKDTQSSFNQQMYMKSNATGSLKFISHIV